MEFIKMSGERFLLKDSNGKVYSKKEMETMLKSSKVEENNDTRSTDIVSEYGNIQETTTNARSNKKSKRR